MEIPSSLAEARPAAERRLCTPSLQAFFLVALGEQLVLQVPKEPTCLSLSDSGEVTNGSLRMEMIPTPQYADTVVGQRVFGVLGVLRLALGRHLVVVTERELCGSIQGRSVWKASAVEAVPIPATAVASGTSEQIKAY